MTEPNITPLARRLAEENGIDWRSLEGSGPDGTIVERDILAFLAKVMAGEVELPPQPEDAQPPEELPDIAQVQEALAREGVDLEEIMPGITSETLPSEAPPVEEEEEVLFEMNFEEELVAEEDASFADTATYDSELASEEAVEGYFAAEAPPEVETPSEPEMASEAVEGYFAAEAPSELEMAEEAAEELVEEAAIFDETEEAAWESSSEQALEEIEELEDEFSWEAAVEETAGEEAAAEVEETPDEAADWKLVEEPQLEPEPEPALAADAESVPLEEPAAPSEELGAAAVAAPLTPEAAEDVPEPEDETQPVASTAVFPPVFRQAVSLAALEKARVDLSEAWKKNVPTSLLLFRAVERALAELEVPMRAVLGKLEGDSVQSLMVYPADNLRALYDHYLNANEPADGLVVIDLGNTPYAEVLLPETPLVTLGYAGMPTGTALLSISGELPTNRARFLERVAFYLERPILLA